MTVASRPFSSRSGFRREAWHAASPRGGLVALGLGLVLAGALSATAWAQDQALTDRVDRLQQELMTLQRHVYGGGSSSGSGAAPSGDSANRPLVARLELRLSQLEDEMRRLTGQIEEVSHRINQFGKRLDNLVADVDQRLQRLEQGAPPLAAAPGEGEQMAAPAADPNAPPAAPAQPGQPLDGGPKVLGSVPASDVEALRQQQAARQQGTASSSGSAGTQQTAALAGATPKEHYDHAFALLSQANYPAAEQALLSFLESYPDDPLAGNANYWLGETYYVRGDYRQAAVTFAEGFQRYPRSSKAPDNLLKLGKSLAALGQTADACGTFAELKKRYADAPATIHQQASTEQQRLSC